MHIMQAMPHQTRPDHQAQKKRIREQKNQQQYSSSTVIDEKNIRGTTSGHFKLQEYTHTHNFVRAHKYTSIDK